LIFPSDKKISKLSKTIKTGKTKSRTKTTEHDTFEGKFHLEATPDSKRFFHVLFDRSIDQLIDWLIDSRKFSCQELVFYPFFQREKFLKDYFVAEEALKFIFLDNLSKRKKNSQFQGFWSKRLSPDLRVFFQILFLKILGSSTEHGDSLKITEKSFSEEKRPASAVQMSKQSYTDLWFRKRPHSALPKLQNDEWASERQWRPMFYFSKKNEDGRKFCRCKMKRTALN
jgi:hypothetical protein